MTTMNTNKVELNEMELDMVNGGFGWNDLVENVMDAGKKAFEVGKKVTKMVKIVVEEKIVKPVTPVVENLKETIQNMDWKNLKPADPVQK